MYTTLQYHVHYITIPRKLHWECSTWYSNIKYLWTIQCIVLYSVLWVDYRHCTEGTVYITILCTLQYYVHYNSLKPLHIILTSSVIITLALHSKYYGAEKASLNALNNWLIDWLSNLHFFKRGPAEHLSISAKNLWNKEMEIFKYHNTIYPPKYRGNLCPAIGSTGVIAVRYQLPFVLLCFIRIFTIILFLS
jgi:hypothetical protein